MERFRRKFDDLAGLRRDGSDRLHAEQKRLLADLNESAERTGPSVPATALRGVEEYLDSRLSTAGVADIEKQGLRRAEELITALLRLRDEQTTNQRPAADVTAGSASPASP